MSPNTSLPRVARTAALFCAHGLTSALLAVGTAAQAAEDATIQQLRDEIRLMRQEYEARLKALEARLEQAQTQARQPALQAPAPAASASSTAQTHAGTTAPAPSASTMARDNRFNPAISLTLSGLYTNLSKDPETWRIAGFIPGGDEIGPGERGFSLAESELNFSANIDSWLHGALTLAVTPEDTVETEEAFIQTTALPGGLTLKAGRFFGGLGYLNEQHAHRWDFVDAPLAHQAFFGGQYRQEGLQARWLAPTDQFIELGMEAGRGAGFPGSQKAGNGLGAFALMAHTGGDIGISHNWRAGVSWLNTRAHERTWETTDAFDQDVTNAFTGRSRLWVVDGVWKWAPSGNARSRSLVLQGEYFRRTESGELTYDVDNTATLDGYRSRQSGWYLQGVYQFAPRWRLGLRHDRLDPGTPELGLNAANLVATSHEPRRDSLMLDWSPSEFQRWRIQFNHDRASEGRRDTQFFLQYLVNLGAHGAHGY